MEPGTKVKLLRNCNGHHVGYPFRKGAVVTVLEKPTKASRHVVVVARDFWMTVRKTDVRRVRP